MVGVVGSSPIAPTNEIKHLAATLGAFFLRQTFFTTFLPHQVPRVRNSSAVLAFMRSLNGID